MITSANHPKLAFSRQKTKTRDTEIQDVELKEFKTNSK